MKTIYLLFALSLTGCVTGLNVEPIDNAPPEDPNCKYQVYRHEPNSWLLINPNMKLVFWGTYWSNNYPEAENILSDWDYMSNNTSDFYGGRVLQRLAEYGISEGQTDDTYFNNNLDIDGQASINNVVTIDDTTIVPSLNAEIQLGDLPIPDDNTLYMIILPPYMNSKTLVKQDWIGYHGQGLYGQQKYAWGIIEYASVADGLNSTISHELYEAATDPDGHGYFDNATTQEIADICEGAVDHIGVYEVQKVFSQTICQCL